MPNYKKKTGTKTRKNGSNSSRNMRSGGGKLKTKLLAFWENPVGNTYESGESGTNTNEDSQVEIDVERRRSSGSKRRLSGSRTSRIGSRNRLNLQLTTRDSIPPTKSNFPKIEPYLSIKSRQYPSVPPKLLEQYQNPTSRQLSARQSSFSNNQPLQLIESQTHNDASYKETPYKGKDYDFKPEILSEFKELLKKDIYYFERYPDTAPPIVDPINFDYKTGKCLLKQNLAKTVDFEACTKTHMNLAGSLKGKPRKIKNFLGLLIDVLPDTRIDGNPKFWISRGVDSKRVYDYSNLYKTENAQNYKKLIESGYLL